MGNFLNQSKEQNLQQDNQQHQEQQEPHQKDRLKEYLHYLNAEYQGREMITSNGFII
jgi:hypothetical protein